MSAVIAAPSSQAMIALEKANAIRVARAAEFSRIRSLQHADGLRAAAELLESDPLPEYLQSAQVERFVCQIRKVGPRKQGKLLVRAAGATPTRRLGDLSARQRAALAQALRNTGA